MKHITRRRANTVWVIVLITATLILTTFITINIAIAAKNAQTYRQFWLDEASKPVPPNALRLLALGDSSAEAIGASKPLDGYVGRSAAYLTQQTGRPVHITNLATGGDDSSGMRRRQLPKANVQQMDIVLIGQSSDMESRKNMQTYKHNLEIILTALPAEKVIISDLPSFPGRTPYQKTLVEVTDGFGVRRADFAKVFNNEGRRLDIFSWLPPHLNSRGYYYWFRAFQPSLDEIINFQHWRSS